MLHLQHTQPALTQYIRHIRQYVFEVSRGILFHNKTTFIDAVSVFRSVSVLLCKRTFHLHRIALWQQLYTASYIRIYTVLLKCGHVRQYKQAAWIRLFVTSVLSAYFLFFVACLNYG